MFKFSECGRLTRVGHPILISSMERPNKKCGVWMKDTYKVKNQSLNDKVWSVPIPGRQVTNKIFK